LGNHAFLVRQTSRTIILNIGWLLKKTIFIKINLNENQLVNFKSITEDFFKYLNKDIKICKSEKEAKEIALNLSDN